MKKPFVSKNQLEAIAADIPTPFYLYDEAGIRQTARALYRAFSWNPGFREYFALKATPNPTILKILRDEGCGVDTATGVELEMAERCDFSGSQIMFSSNDTPAADYLRARRMGAVINLDAYEHIDFLSRLTGFDFPETMSLRYNPGGVFKLGTKIMDQPEASKFGMTKNQLLSAVAALTDRGVKHFGLHSFLASNTVTNDYYPTLARELFELAIEIRRATGVTLGFVNLSGGVGVAYRPDERPNDIAIIGQKVHEAYDEVLSAAGLDGIRIFTELGRYMLAPHGLLVTRVLHKKTTYRTYIGVDAGANNLLRPAMYGAYHHITVMGKESVASRETVDVTGGLCENNDKFAIQRDLPPIDEGDLLAIHDAGAHGFSMGYQYNGKLRSAEVLLGADGQHRLIRRAETADDYFQTLLGYGL